MWTAATEIHAKSCLPELVYGSPYSAKLVLVFMWMQPRWHGLVFDEQYWPMNEQGEPTGYWLVRAFTYVVTVADSRYLL